MKEFSLNDLYEKAFGHSVPEKFDIPQAAERQINSANGQPYFLQDALGREMFMPVRLNGYVLPFAVLGMSRKKIIVETPLVERDGAVIEVISNDNYEITIKGILISNDNTFPEADIAKLVELANLNEALELRSVLTDFVLLGDDRVVMRSINFPAVAGVENAKGFEMSFVSDSVYTLTIE